jgi:hypothetical protein
MPNTTTGTALAATTYTVNGAIQTGAALGPGFMFAYAEGRAKGLDDDIARIGAEVFHAGAAGEDHHVVAARERDIERRVGEERDSIAACYLELCVERCDRDRYTRAAEDIDRRHGLDFLESLREHDQRESRRAHPAKVNSLALRATGIVFGSASD